MRWLVTTSQRFWTLVLGALLALGLAGVGQLREARLDVLPELGSTVVNVQTEALGLSAAEVEQLITVPLEQNLLNGIAWIDEIRSESMNGLSSIELHFEPGTNVLDARQMVAERLTRANILPRVSKAPVMLQPVSSSNRLMLVELSSSTISPIELSVLARWNIRPRLMGVPGVANVAIWGQRERQLQVQVTPERLKEHNVTLSEVVRTTANALWVSPLTYVEASTPGSGGFIDAPNQRLGVRHVLPISSPQDLAKVVMTAADGTTVRLGDLAEVVEDHQPLIGDAVVTGRGLAMVVEKFPGESTTAVTEAVEEALRTIGPGLAGVEVDTKVFRPASFIESTLRDLGLFALLALLILVLIVSLVFRGWRTALLSLVAVLASVLVALLALHWLGATFNLVVLAGLTIALGVIVDDAVMAPESIGRRKAGADGLVEAMGPLMFATAAIVCVAAPLLLVDGPARALFRTLGFAYIAAVLASVLVALTVTPALAKVLGSRELTETRAVQWLRARYTTLLNSCLRRPRRTWVAAGLVLVAAFAALFLAAGWPTLPPINDRNLVISFQAPPGTSRAEMIRITNRVTSELAGTAGVNGIAAHVGRAVVGDQVVDVDTAQLLMSIDPHINHDTMVRSIREIMASYPGTRAEVLAYPDERTATLFESAPSAIGVRVYGSDDTVLQRKATEIRGLLEHTGGVRNARVDAQTGNPTVKIQVDLAAAQEHGVKPGDVRRAASVLIAGIEVGNLFEEQKVFDVLVVGSTPHRESVTSIRELLIDTPGGQTKLGDLAKVEVSEGLPIIRHEAVTRYVDVLADVAPGADSAEVNDNVRALVEDIDFPKEHHAEVVNEASRDADYVATTVHIIAALVAVFLLLQAVLRGWWLALVMSLLLPVAIAGGVIAAVLSRATFSFGVIAGLVAVAAMTIRWMFLGASNLQRGHDNADRLGPVLATTLVTGGTMAILVLAGGAGLGILRPTAIVILGGLITSAATVLLAVPVAYSRWRPAS